MTTPKKTQPALWVMVPVTDKELSNMSDLSTLLQHKVTEKETARKGSPKTTKQSTIPTNKTRAKPRGRYGFFTNKVLALIESGKTGGAAIAKELNVDGTRVYPVLTYLRKNGYIEGYRDEIHLTPQGREKLEMAANQS